ncbi:MAG: hypothetical protein NVSMB1_04410 [Polyangiales bacterium]
MVSSSGCTLPGSTMIRSLDLAFGVTTATRGSEASEALLFAARSCCARCLGNQEKRNAADTSADAKIEMAITRVVDSFAGMGKSKPSGCGGPSAGPLSESAG